MLKRTPALSGMAPSAPDVGPAEGGGGLDLSSTLAFARRQWPIVAVTLLLSLALAGGCLLVTPPTYLGKANLLLDTRKLQLFQKESVLGELSFDAPAVESQIEILK